MEAGAERGDQYRRWPIHRVQWPPPERRWRLQLVRPSSVRGILLTATPRRSWVPRHIWQHQSVPCARCTSDIHTRGRGAVEHAGGKADGPVAWRAGQRRSDACESERHSGLRSATRRLWRCTRPTGSSTGSLMGHSTPTCAGTDPAGPPHRPRSSTTSSSRSASRRRPYQPGPAPAPGSTAPRPHPTTRLTSCSPAEKHWPTCDAPKPNPTSPRRRTRPGHRQHPPPDRSTHRTRPGHTPPEPSHRSAPAFRGRTRTQPRIRPWTMGSGRGRQPGRPSRRSRQSPPGHQARHPQRRTAPRHRRHRRRSMRPRHRRQRLPRHRRPPHSPHPRPARGRTRPHINRLPRRNTRLALDDPRYRAPSPRTRE
ncbi:hypothetical protein ABID94_003414 [Streptomyces sp. PvR018]